MQEKITCVLETVNRVIKGKDTVVRKLLTAILADGHILMDDVPGNGKTTLAVAVSRAVGLRYNRIQFTPDVMPSDIVGFSLYSRETGTFVYHPGILSETNLLLGDEINRTSSKTQSALLEAMEERHVTVDGQTYALPKPFIVIATQNPVGAAGTQLLPYAQMDRFLVRLSIGYPDYDAQMELLRERQFGDPLDGVRCIVTKPEIDRMQQQVTQVAVKDAVLDYITRLALASREHPALDVGISPRGTLCLCRMAKAWAYMEERDYVTGADVQAVFYDVCEHRLVLSRKARMAGASEQHVLRELLETVEISDSRLQR